MNIKAITYKLLAAVAIWAITACADEKPATTESIQGIEMSGIAARMSRAGELEVADLKDYVGKKEFDNDDRAVFTTIKRTANPIAQFNYSNLEFICAASTSAAGVTSIGWSRNKEKGTTAATGDAHPDRIYWSDATNPHTFTGFCTPQQGGGKAFDWEERDGAYYGSIGDPTLHTSSDIIDYRSTFDGEGKETQSGNVELRKNDILLTHSTEVKAEDAIAKLYFYHGLAQVRVIVNISEFAAGGGDDTKSTVSDMILKNMLTMYKWRKNSVATEQLPEADQSIVDALYPSDGVIYNQTKDFNLWIPEPKGVGEKSSRTFTFYGMVVPTAYVDANGEKLSFSFKVEYPDPMKPTQMKEHTYQASISDIQFDAGKCTTISISLNHKNEKITVGAEYDDWEFIATPDQGALKKNSTFLTSTARTADSEGKYNVTIIGDPNATVDDATWLYINSEGKIVDIYDNDGSAAHPFQISTADQLLSFAYEVKGTNRTSKTYKGLDNAGHTLDAGFDFTGYCISLDADITLQATATRTKQEMKSSDDGYDSAPNAIEWIGIGASDKPFNGIFLGGFRHIYRLYGSPLFINIGVDGIVDHLSMSNTISILGSGSIAETNAGIICGAYIEGDIVENTTPAPKHSGSIVGVNTGVLIACTHVGNITSNSEILGALLGSNDGIVVTCYNVGDVKNTAGFPAYAGIGEFTNRSIAYCCYFNEDLYTSHDYDDLKVEPQIGHVAFPLTTAVMQSSKFVNQAAKAVTPTDDDTGEITDVRKKDDIFFYHWSLREGLNRAIALLSTVYDAHPEVPDDGYLTFHGEADRGGYLSIGLKKSQVKWLIDHYVGHSHEFQFIPGTYPKLK